MHSPKIFESDIKSISEISRLFKFSDCLLIFHQIEVMHKNYQDAFFYFEQLYEYRMHALDFMEKYLLPIYLERVNPLPSGGNEKYFLREKKQIEKHLTKYIRFFSNLAIQEKKEIDIVTLFEGYVYLKDLLDHHDARESGILFSAINNVINVSEEKELTEKFNESVKKMNKRWN